MSRLDDLRAAGSAVRQLPRAVLRRGCQSLHAVVGRNDRYPVLLVHGYAGSESVWAPTRAALADAGFGHVVSLNYNSFVTEPAELAAEVARIALTTLDRDGGDRIHLVGHSLGGLIVRHAISSTPSVAAVTATAVTIASPHQGAPLARIAPGRCARIMQQRGSSPVEQLSALRKVRWLSYYSDADRVVPPSSARLDETHYRATNLLIPGAGHLTICRDARLIRSLVTELIRTESPTSPASVACATAVAA